MSDSSFFRASFETLRQDILALVDSLDEAGWRWSPGPRTWSIAQCVDHINTVNGLVVPRLEKAIRFGHEQGLCAEGPFRYPLFDRLFVFALEPRAPVKQPAPGIYRPGQGLAQAEARSRFIELQARLVDCAAGSEGLDLVHIKIASPVSPLLRFSLGTWFNALLAHEQNHLEQARRLI